MFSGIIQSLQPVTKFEKTSGHLWVTIKKPRAWKTKLGESISIDGVCSTICKQTTTSFTFEYMPETLRLTTLKNIKKNQDINLERSLKLNDLVGGHLVSGHIDATGIIKAIKKDDQSKIFTIKFPEKFKKYLISKGSIAINGISMTVINPKKDKFQIATVQHTLKHTNLGKLKINDKVNLEFDQVAKYIEKGIRA